MFRSNFSFKFFITFNQLISPVKNYSFISNSLNSYFCKMIIPSPYNISMTDFGNYIFC